MDMDRLHSLQRKRKRLTQQLNYIQNTETESANVSFDMKLSKIGLENSIQAINNEIAELRYYDTLMEKYND